MARSSTRQAWANPRRHPVPARAAASRVLDDVATNVAGPYAHRMSGKQRLSASVDAELIAAAEDAVAQGRAATVSAWVNDALRLKLEHDRRLAAVDDFIAAYEAEHGEITADEMRMATRRARARAKSARALPLPKPKRAGRGR